MKYNNYVILSDFDGTLTNNDGRLRESEIEHINYFTSQGGTFGIATGRGLQDAKERLTGVNINSPCILGNGAIIGDIKDGTIIREKILPPDCKKLLKAISEKFPNTIVQASHCKGTVTVHYCEIFHELFEGSTYDFTQDVDNIKHLNSFKKSIKEYIVNIDEVKEPIIKANVCVRPSLLAEVLSWIRQQPMAVDYKVISSGSFIIDINSRGVNKGEAASYLREHYYCSKDIKIIALGDEENDLEALKNADISFAPQWAREEVKESVDYVLDTERSLIAQVIEFLDKDL